LIPALRPAYASVLENPDDMPARSRCHRFKLSSLIVGVLLRGADSDVNRDARRSGLKSRDNFDLEAEGFRYGVALVEKRLIDVDDIGVGCEKSRLENGPRKASAKKAAAKLDAARYTPSVVPARLPAKG
jgi:hypothetical protein